MVYRAVYVSMSKSQDMQWWNTDRSRLLADLSARLYKEGTNEMSEEDIVTILRDLKDKVDLMQRDQATIRSDIVEHVFRILKKRWSDEETKRRESSW